MNTPERIADAHKMALYESTSSFFFIFAVRATPLPSCGNVEFSVNPRPQVSVFKSLRTCGSESAIRRPLPNAFVQTNNNVSRRNVIVSCHRRLRAR